MFYISVRSICFISQNLYAYDPEGWRRHYLYILTKYLLIVGMPSSRLGSLHSNYIPNQIPEWQPGYDFHRHDNDLA